MIRHLSHGDLEALNLQAQDITAMLERLIAGAANGTVFAAPKAAFSTPDGRYIMATLAAMDDPPFVATKSLVLNKENSLIGLPQINALVTLLDGQTGVPLATMDGNWVTGIRTAGLSALAAKYLARTDAKSIGFVGTGLQARSHLALFRQMFPLEHVKISGRGQANIDALAQAAAPLEVTICATPEQAIRDTHRRCRTVS
jgi:ornithine cyclodeaminase/alanine dehydrogenase